MKSVRAISSAFLLQAFLLSLVIATASSPPLAQSGATPVPLATLSICAAVRWEKGGEVGTGGARSLDGYGTVARRTVMVRAGICTFGPRSAPDCKISAEEAATLGYTDCFDTAWPP